MEGTFDAPVLDKPFRKEGLAMRAKVVQGEKTVTFAEERKGYATRLCSRDLVFRDHVYRPYVYPIHLQPRGLVSAPHSRAGRA